MMEEQTQLKNPLLPCTLRGILYCLFVTVSLTTIFYHCMQLVPQRDFLDLGLGTDPGMENGEVTSCLKNYFQDVLLIIVYHYPFYETLVTIMPHYKDAFPHIVVCGPNESLAFPIMTVDMGPNGYLSQACLGKAIRIHPGHRGYLFVNDDMVVNWWNFANFHKDKIWSGAPVLYQKAHEVGHRPLLSRWTWWASPYGALGCEAALRKIAHLALVDVTVKRLFGIHIQNGKNKTVCFETWSDFAYVPGRWSRQFEFLCSIFVENNVFVEIAIPTILSFLDEYDSWLKVFGIYLPDIHGYHADYFDPSNWWPEFSKDILFLHPVKFLGKRGRDNRKIFESRVRNYAKKFTC